MNVVDQSLDGLAFLVSERSPDVAKIRGLIETIREEFRKLNDSQQKLIESNAALIQRCAELERCAKRE